MDTGLQKSNFEVLARFYILLYKYTYPVSKGK